MIENSNVSNVVEQAPTTVSLETAPKTNQEILAELVAAQKAAAIEYLAGLENSALSAIDVEKLNTKSTNAGRAVSQFRAKIDADEKKVAAEKALAEYVGIVDLFLNQLNTVMNDSAATTYEEIKNRLKIAFVGGSKKPVLNIAPGMTGKQLEKALAPENGTKQTEDKPEGRLQYCIRRLDEGATVEQIMTEELNGKNFTDHKGGPNGTLRTAVTERNKRDAVKS